MAERIPPSKQTECAACGKVVWKSRTSAEVQFCIACRRAGKAPSNLAHGTPRRYRAGCRCDECREDNNRRGRVTQRRARLRGYVRVDRRDRTEVLCAQCGSPLAYTGQGAKLHRACRNAFRSAERKRARARARLAKAAEGVPANPMHMFLVGTCAYCLQGFTRRAASVSAYCSSRCRRADKPAPVRPSVRRQVFERDGWICQLCMEPVDRDAPPHSDWSATVDHIIPQSHGGPHEPNNLRCAHRWCNSVRGDETYYPAEILLPA